MQPTPIKRNEFLKPISREHHYGLLVSWKIRAGIKKEIDPIRIKTYLNWFYKNHLLAHFKIEEKYIFPILGNDHELVRKALSEHRSLIRLFKSEKEIVKNINLIEEELESHIRFEERVLFNEIQEVATEEQLEQIKIHHTEEKFIDNTSDAFWL
jgi:iron-sulfur cluster repair protein YtfE (RIC family)